MKHLIAVLAIAAALLTAQVASATPISNNSEVVVTGCTVNGVNYPVDGYFNVWGVNAYGQWAIIGHLFATANGWAVVSNGLTYGAACY